MNMAEFHEFICRWAELIFYDLKIPLTEKIEKLLDSCFLAVKMEFNSPKLIEDVDSDSDYEDEIVDNNGIKTAKSSFDRFNI